MRKAVTAFRDQVTSILESTYPHRGEVVALRLRYHELELLRRLAQRHYGVVLPSLGGGTTVDELVLAFEQACREA